jgi:hypothetical protein
MFRAFIWTSQRPNLDDFGVYHEAATLIAAGESPYVYTRVWAAGYRFKYSPFAAQMYAPVAGTDRGVSGWIHYVVTGLLWLLLVGWIGREYLHSLWRTAGVFFVFYSCALRDELKLGQANIWAIGGMLISLRLYRTHPWVAALALAFALQFKLFVLIVAPFFLLQRQWLLLASVAVFSVALSFGGPALFHGVDFAIRENLKWYKALSESTRELIIYVDNGTVMGVFAKLWDSYTAGVIAWVAAVGLFLWAQWRMRKSLELSMGLQTAGILALTPMGWPYWILFTFPAMLWIHAERKRWASSPWIWVTTYAVLAVCMNLTVGFWAARGAVLLACVLMSVILVRLVWAKQTKAG